MSYTYTYFTKQNIAPHGTKSIGIYDKNEKLMFRIESEELNPLNKQNLYSFGLVSDIHLYHLPASWNPNEKFENALTYFEHKNCKMCIISGDLTQTGLYRRTDANDANTTYMDEGQLSKYKEICDKQTIPIYALSGNHESYFGMSINDNLDKWEHYTRKNSLHYSFEQDDDLFILLGQPSGSIPMSDEALQWLYRTLEANRNRRCFIFVHPDISSGNPSGAYSSNRIFDFWGKKTTAFKNMLKHYKNTILFHGHSHTKFESQEEDREANYSIKDGFRSVHIPSLGRPRNVTNGIISSYLDSESQGYLVDVYNDCIVLNGIDFIQKRPVPLGTYKIDTTLKMIDANTFTDTTGIIRTTST